MSLTLNQISFKDVFISLIERLQLHDSEEIDCPAVNGNWSEWIESDDSTCTFNNDTTKWTKNITRTCNDQLYGGTCAGRLIIHGELTYIPMYYLHKTDSSILRMNPFFRPPVR